MSDSPQYNLSIGSAELLAACARQDQDALRELFGRHERSVYNLLLRMLGNVEDAEDALADVFVKVWRSASRFKGECSVSTWLYRVAANTARDVLRSRQSRRKLEVTDLCYATGEAIDLPGPDSDNPETMAIAASETDVILKAMAGLSEDDRLLITLYHLQECDYDQVAKIMNTRPENLKVRLFRARQRLKRLCADVEREPKNHELRTDSTKPSGLREGTTDWA